MMEGWRVVGLHKWHFGEEKRKGLIVYCMPNYIMEIISSVFTTGRLAYCNQVVPLPVSDERSNTLLPWKAQYCSVPRK